MTARARGARPLWRPRRAVRRACYSPSMTENQRETARPAAMPPGTEERGIVTDVIVPIVAGGAGGAAQAVVANYLQNHPSEPPPPPIELPPGVDLD
jgi:hypothetical protein